MTEQENRKLNKHKHHSKDAVAIVDEVLREAAESGASDVHFEPTASELLVKFRLDGVLDVVEHFPQAIADNVISRLKVLGSLLTYRNDIPQEGRIEVGKELGEKIFDQRLAIFPTIHGQRAVVRIFYKHTELIDLDQLGFSNDILSTIKAVVAGNQGVLLATGPAGSGKSTTLAAILRFIMNRFPGKSIVTLEDPVEISIEGATQVQISQHGQMTFPTALRSLLRQDPEVLMIGEIRDAETAGIVIEAGLTGHLLLSTMHGGKPTTALLRLLEMGIEPYQVTSSVSGVINQRLIRKLCTHCKIKNDTTGFYEARGCDACFGTGYHGRVLIAEMVRLGGPLRQALLAKTDLDGLDTLLEAAGHKSIFDNGRHLVEEGVTSIAELNKACGIVET
jgi:general secretion pathway protein E